MTRVIVRSEVEVPVRAEVVWDYVTDWPLQGEWIPFTRVEEIGRADRVGGRIRAWTGIGPIGFWDEMTITAWATSEDGSGRCEVLHHGSVIRGDAEFSVVARGFGACSVRWWEHLELPGGPLGRLAWKVTGPGMQRMVDLALRRMAARAEGVNAG